MPLATELLPPLIERSDAFEPLVGVRDMLRLQEGKGTAMDESVHHLFYCHPYFSIFRGLSVLIYLSASSERSNSSEVTNTLCLNIGVARRAAGLDR